MKTYLPLALVDNEVHYIAIIIITLFTYTLWNTWGAGTQGMLF